MWLKVPSVTFERESACFLFLSFFLYDFHSIRLSLSYVWYTCSPVRGSTAAAAAMLKLEFRCKVKKWYTGRHFNFTESTVASWIQLVYLVTTCVSSRVPCQLWLCLFFHQIAHWLSPQPTTREGSVQRNRLHKDNLATCKTWFHLVTREWMYFSGIVSHFFTRRWMHLSLCLHAECNWQNNQIIISTCMCESMLLGQLFSV